MSFSASNPPTIAELERRVRTLEEKLAGQKPLTFTVPECNTPCNAYEEPKPTEEYKPPAESPIGQSIERLAAYFDKHAKENTKRAEKLDKELTSNFHPWDEYGKKSKSSYYFSGKADTYARAAEKLREVLGWARRIE